MISTTRFCPTANGGLHVGHAYSAIFNYMYAREHGGRFVLRIDDRSPTTRVLDENTRKKIIESQLDDIKWLGIKPDDTYLESDWVAKHFKEPWKYVEEDPRHMLPHYVRMAGTGWLAIPWIPGQTYIRAKMDYVDGVTHVIRGEEWATEYSLYVHFCNQEGFPAPNFMYLPRLVGKDGKDISKTAGGNKIIELRRAGWTRAMFIEKMERSVLLWPPSGWETWNLKPNPAWVG
jgi:glutamyl/glutaminyl-tRNA synthetase